MESHFTVDLNGNSVPQINPSLNTLCSGALGVPHYDNSPNAQMFLLTELTERNMAALRQMIREEVRALHDDAESPSQLHVVRIEGAATAHIEIEHEGVRYAGNVYPVLMEGQP